jgi:epoxyqueuosine reductase
VVTAYLGYHTGEAPPEGLGLGVIAPYTRANFYRDLLTRLRRIAGGIESGFGAVSKVSSNYVTLAEKPLAARSGLGFYGKNGIIISPRHGSYIVLGEIVTDLEIEPDPPLETDCGECSACMKACPTGAIERPGWVNRGRCIQYIGERRGTVPLDVREVWGNRLYGCSTCQEVCPFNRDVPAAAPDSPPAAVGASVPLEEALRMGQTDFVRRFEGNQIGMRERNVIRRNALIAAGASGAADLAGHIEACFNDPDPMIRAHALWSFARLRGKEAGPRLERAAAGEWDPDVRKEAESA